jgi:hypothetical protein
MIWLTWRQLRTSATAAAGVMAAVVVLLLITAPRLAHDYDTSGLLECFTDDGNCGPLERQFLGQYPIRGFLGYVLLTAPALIGVFWGAPLLARELETGTYRLAWTQSVTRSRWLAAKLAPIGGLAVAITAAFSLAFTWWSEPFDRLGSRVTPEVFSQRGIAPIAYAAFAFTLGATAGAVIRRTLPAMAATLLGFVIARSAIQTWIRPRLAQPVELSYPTFTFYAPDPAALASAERSWVLSGHTLDGTGHVIGPAGQIPDSRFAELCGLSTANPTKEALDACGERLSLHDVLRVHPADQFWTLQAWETAIFLALALGLGFLCIWWIRRRIT